MRITIAVSPLTMAVNIMSMPIGLEIRTYTIGKAGIVKLVPLGSMWTKIFMYGVVNAKMTCWEI